MASTTGAKTFLSTSAGWKLTPIWEREREVTEGKRSLHYYLSWIKSPAGRCSNNRTEWSSDCLNDNHLLCCVSDKLGGGTQGQEVFGLVLCLLLLLLDLDPAAADLFDSNDVDRLGVFLFWLSLQNPLQLLKTLTQFLTIRQSRGALYI